MTFVSLILVYMMFRYHASVLFLYIYDSVAAVALLSFFEHRDIYACSVRLLTVLLIPFSLGFVLDQMFLQWFHYLIAYNIGEDVIYLVMYGFQVF